ncbi:MAG: UDP-N-acetylglucosamine 2-epimerase (non-hydrolyzing) [candidate division NC10 bacterium]|nr:UDP-N-acetylglucosamine 2-epimerase (non-hydrolyzing) [candidate division NC10 bacterium]
MRILSIVGARPQFIKAAPLSRKLRKAHQEILLHTGQHYDYELSQAFFEELNLPQPDYHLGVGSGTHARQTARMLMGIEKALLAERPDLVLVYGDTNSTLAGALAAAKLQVPVAHVEAGLRSFDPSMPEEINRILADRLSTLLFCPTPTAVQNLAREGIEKGVHLVGDVMVDALQEALPLAESRSRILARLALEPKSYLLATLHRAGNTEDPRRLSSILEAFNSLEEPVIFPLHPRTGRAMKAFDLRVKPPVRILRPVPYLDNLILEKNARLILTDSGGMQKEAYLLGVPCLTLREETEWVETVEAGWNLLVGSDLVKIKQAVREFQPQGERKPLFGAGDASDQIVRSLSANH